MSSSRDVHVGIPSIEFPLEESVVIHFHDFENLNSEKDKCVESPNFTCAGNKWSLSIFPGGNNVAKEGMVSVFLNNKTTERISAWVKVSIRKYNYVRYDLDRIENVIEEEMMFPSQMGRGWSDFRSRNGIIQMIKNFTDGGTLSLLVTISPHRSNYCQLVKPPSELTLGKNISRLFRNHDTADLAFKVGNTIFYAHKLILKAQAPEILELSESFDMSTPMVINDMEPKMFEIMLGHTYGKEIPPHQWKDYGKIILIASGKYGFTLLKTEAEVWYLKNLDLTVENAVDELLFADGIHCLDLKKAVIQFIINNCNEVLNSDSFLRLHESRDLIREVMSGMSEVTDSKKRKHVS